MLPVTRIHHLYLYVDGYTYTSFIFVCCRLHVFIIYIRMLTEKNLYFGVQELGPDWGKGWLWRQR